MLVGRPPSDGTTDPNSFRLRVPIKSVIERTLVWLAQFRRLTIRYERRSDNHVVLLSLGRSLICLNAIDWFR